MSGDNGGSTDIEETEAERAVAEVAMEKFDTYQKHFKPLETEYINRVDDKSGANYQNLVSGLAANAATKEARQAESGLYQGGLNPNSGSFKTKSNALNNAILATKNSAAASGKQAAQNDYLSGLSNVAAIGSGQDAVATNSTRGLADISAAQSWNDARNDFFDYQSDQKFTGAVTGAAANFGLSNASQLNQGANQGSVYSGLKYGTDFGSNQSTMLADQEKGFGLL